MAFGNLKHRTQLPEFENFATQLPGSREVYERGGSEEPEAGAQIRAGQADMLGAKKKRRSMDYTGSMLPNRPMDPYAAMYQDEINGGR